MHRFKVDFGLHDALNNINCWAISTSDLHSIGSMLGAAGGEMRVRYGKCRAIIAGAKFGAAADLLSQELAGLADQVTEIRSTGESSVDICAAAFFHLRFENIHPMVDGNGRVGRLLLAQQCSLFSSVSTGEFLADLHSNFADDYRVIFRLPTAELKYELAVNLLSRMLAIPVPTTIGLRFPLTPIYPERDTRPAAVVTGKSNARSSFF